jgi:integrase
MTAPAAAAGGLSAVPVPLPGLPRSPSEVLGQLTTWAAEASTLPLEALQALLMGCATLQGALAARLGDAAPAGPGASGSAITLLPGAGAPRLREAIENWIAAKTGRPWGEETVEDVRRFTRLWLEHLGDVPLACIRSMEVERLYSSLDTGRLSHGYVNLMLRYFRGFWRHLLAHELVSHDPTRHWPKLRRLPRQVQLALWGDQDGKLFPLLDRRLRRAIPFLIFAGLRIGEVQRLRWSMVIPDPSSAGEWLLSLPTTLRKQREEHIQALSRKAVEALGPRGEPDALVFPELPSRNWIATLLKRACRAAGLPPLKLHDCRRSWSARLSRAGATTLLQQRIGGWASLPTLASAYNPPIPHKLSRSYQEKI